MSSPHTPSNDSYLRIRHLTKKFGEFTALADISLDVREGEFVCFLGPSGCGKTTLLRAIAGLDIQTTGTVEQAGADISALPPSERDFGIVFQSYALFPNMTVARNVAYGLESQRRSRAEVRERVRELLDLVGLPDQGAKYPAQLSGGQQQRIALARAIAMSPGLLLLDEPLSALDAKVRARLRYEVKALQRRLGITTIMVTHDQEEALTMADRIVVMNHGVIDQVGAPVEIYRQPASVFVADFIGTMNFLAAVVTDDAPAGSGGIRAGGLALACDTSGHSDGESVTVAIRPEEITLAAAGDAGNAGADGADDRHGGFDATVEYVEFLGSFARVQLSSAGESLLMDLPIAQIERFGVEEGRSVRAVVPPDSVRIYAGAPPGG
ncbi:MAG: putative 2-aminoethylphosphonate ABC transporter ATP-binding protein [Thiotrichales bacterium]|nr:putative 2-aminoethylphosphonate ABC transporter ATP-binding protein [Thiotrichales bacterium]